MPTVTETPTATFTPTATQTPCATCQVCPPTATPLVGTLILHAVDEETGQALPGVQLIFKAMWNYTYAYTVTFVGFPVILSLTPGAWDVTEDYPIDYGSFYTNANYLTVNPEDYAVWVWLYSRHMRPQPVNPSPTPCNTPVVVTPVVSVLGVSELPGILITPVYIVPGTGMACPCLDKGRALYECASRCPEEEYD